MFNLRSLTAALALAALLSPAAYAAAASKTFTITNTGNGPLTVLGAHIAGNTTDYALSGNTCTSVPAGGSCALTVKFAPTGDGPRAAGSLNFSSNGSNGPSHSIALSGTGRVLPPASCKTLLASAPGTPSGYYTLQPDRTGTAEPFQAYCDMTTDGGGWTRVNSNVVQTSSRSFGADDTVSGNSVGSTSCSTVNSNWTVTNPIIGYNNIRLEFTRTTTVMQCSSIYSGTASVMANGAFWSGSSWVTNNTCVWGDGIWANGSVDATGLPDTWRLLANKSPNGIIRFATLCGFAGDTGAFTATMWLR